MTTVRIPDTFTYTTTELVSGVVEASARAYGSEGWGFESLRARSFPVRQTPLQSIVLNDSEAPHSEQVAAVLEGDRRRVISAAKVTEIKSGFRRRPDTGEGCGSGRRLSDRPQGAEIQQVRIKGCSVSSFP